MPQYHLYFGVPIDGPTTGLIFALFTVGNMTGAWAAGPAADFWGRRWGMVIGSVIVLAGVAIQGSAQNGKFLQVDAIEVNILTSGSESIHGLSCGSRLWSRYRGFCGANICHRDGTSCMERHRGWPLQWVSCSHLRRARSRTIDTK